MDYDKKDTIQKNGQLANRSCPVRFLKEFIQIFSRYFLFAVQHIARKLCKHAHRS